MPAVASGDSEPAVGIGVRRESRLAPHVGRGFGGKRVLTGDLDEDRAAVVEVLERLAEQARRGDLDAVLSAVPTSDQDT